MKRIFWLFILVTLTTRPDCQVTQHKSIPFFDITQTDGTHLKATDLAKGQPVMIVYFDPDCDHCVSFIDDLLKNAALFRNSEVVLVTYVPLRRLKNYVSESGLEDYPQIKTGTEGNKFVVRYHYDVIQFPFIALHDRYGNMFESYEGEVPSAKDLAVLLKGK